jgi:ketosteroid isomerase-like protein
MRQRAHSPCALITSIEEAFMTANIELVQRLNDACTEKDFDTARALLHPNYTLDDPFVKCSNPDEFIEFMQNCPFDGKMENVQFIEDGDKVVQLFDCVVKSPVAYRIHMCDVLTLEDGKIRSEEMFYDTAKMPKEALELSRDLKGAKDKAA